MQLQFHLVSLFENPLLHDYIIIETILSSIQLIMVISIPVTAGIYH